MIRASLTPTPLLEPGERPRLEIVEPVAGRARRLEVALAMVRLAARILVLKVTGRATARNVGARLRRTIESLGGLWIKFGQLLSLRHDLYPPAFCLELMGVQDKAKGFPGHVARRVIEEAYGVPVEAVFEWFDDQPVAAASIGQVHRARLRRGRRDVAVKVQRPDAVETFTKDLGMIGFLLRRLGSFESMRNLRFDEFHWEVHRMFEEELDYRREATRQRRMRGILRHHRIYVPRIWKRYVTDRVLVMEFLHGVFMSEFLLATNKDPERVRRWLETNEIDPRRVGRTLYQSFMRQVLEEPIFHSDLHPGNIVLFREGRVGLIDFGASGRLYPDLRRPILELNYKLSRRANTEAADAMLRLVGPGPRTDLDEYRRDIVQVFRKWQSNSEVPTLPYAERSAVFMYEKMGEVSKRHQVVVTWDYLRIDRGNFTLNVSLMHLFPEMDFTEELRRFFREGVRRRRTRRNPRGRVERGADAFRAVAETGTRMVGALTAVESSFKRSALGFEGTTSKLGFLAGEVLRELRWLLLLLAALFTVAYLDREYGPFPVESTRLRLDDLLHARDWPIGFWRWSIGLAGILWLRRTLGQLASHAMRKGRPPGRSS